PPPTDTYPLSLHDALPISNPIGAIASVAMLLRYGLRLTEAADAVDQAIRAVLDAGARTRDIAEPGAPAIGTREMGERIAGVVLRSEEHTSELQSRENLVCR